MTLEFLNNVTEYLNTIKRGGSVSSVEFGAYYTKLTGKIFSFSNCRSCILNQIKEMETTIQKFRNKL